ncbi:uncharacterized protein LOC144654085 [Oculina patagonica]
MDNVEEILQTLFIGIAVATFLLHTYRYSKAIELFSECLVLLKRFSSKLEKEKLSELYALVYQRLFNLNCLVGDYKNAVCRGEEGIQVFSEIGDVGSAAGLADKIGDLYQSSGEQGKAKEKYEKAFTCYFSEMMVFNYFDMPAIKRKENLNKMLVVATKIGDKEREGMILSKLGELSLSLFLYPEAKDYFQRELAIWKETSKRKEEAQALIALGNLYKDNEEYELAKRHYEEAMVIMEEVGETYEQGVVYGKLGVLCNLRYEYAEAKALHKKALEISVKNEDKKGEIIDLRNIADVHVNLGECDEARECYSKALVISKEIGNQEEEASTYSDFGDFYRSVNDYVNAEINCKKALEMYSEIGNIDKEGYVNSQLGLIYNSLGRYDEAMKCFERVLAVSKQTGEKRREGGAYGNLGTVYQSLGDYGKAKECHEQSLAISVETDHLRGQAIDYGHLGAVYQHLGDYETAYKHHKKALEMKIRIDHKEGLPAEYHNLGFLCEHLGKYAEANEFCRKAYAAAKEIGDRGTEAEILASLASREQIVGEAENAKMYYEKALKISKEIGDIKQEATMMGNLGTVYQSLGNVAAAKKNFEESLAIIKKIGCRDKEGAALGNLAALYCSQGEYATARTFYEEALAISRETRDKKAEMAWNNNLGSLYLSQNEFQRALECFQRALQICEQMGDIHGKSMSYGNIAGVYMVCQDTPKALSYLSMSIKCLEGMRGSIGESEHFKMGFADKNAAPYRLMVTVLLALGCVDKALSISELARARSLTELMETQYSCQHLPGFHPNRWIDFANVIQRRSCTCLSFFFVHERLYCWIIKAGGVEVVTSKGLTADIRPQGASIQDWLENLANQSYRKFLLLQGERCEDRSLFLWDENTKERSPSKPEEGVTTCLVTDQEEEEEKKPQALKDLYSAIIAPALKFLKGSEIIIVPDRSLYRIPFAALMDESGKYLSEKFRTRFIPSLTTLKLIQDSPANYHSQTGVLIVGDPEVGLPELCPPLPCAREEAEMIGRLLNVRPLTGKQATKQAVLQKIHSVSLIHIAAHGNADRGDIALAPAQQIKGKPKTEDFVLTMSDISRVQLRAKLVVLSCCHSGLGQIKAEGVVGIARAFLGSGARSVLVSLWAVDDSATMQFMKQFYGHLVRGKSAGESLHETMKWMRGNPQYREVRKWAPFMLIGDDVSFKFKK